MNLYSSIILLQLIESTFFTDKFNFMHVGIHQVRIHYWSLTITKRVHIAPLRKHEPKVFLTATTFVNHHVLVMFHNNVPVLQVDHTQRR